jgi:transcription antitermination factor NusG
MIDSSSARTSSNTVSSPEPPSRRFAPGDRIRITTGKLAGLTGKVSWPRDRDTYALTIDSWMEGVYVVVSSQSLERLNE